ncbi:hypothetical protein BU26DRAFT_564308 [Trematosphaeria pertusa]|uniref:DUF6590 domain-containing protein n=1 Tax=Trematosphaeria pertusa TaxID=390896 RepID=A0A6A6IJQ6_9PLEO|nr:uncharacterized protein BU26DRAFT_564308 [Trematosphaeria pertusa]KAF2250459.1 hypothetical protein BU26DRAFT_564308 [Trematosphaeria pertusa]
MSHANIRKVHTPASSSLMSSEPAITPDMDRNRANRFGSIGPDPSTTESGAEANGTAGIYSYPTHTEAIATVAQVSESPPSSKFPIGAGVGRNNKSSSAERREISSPSHCLASRQNPRKRAASPILEADPPKHARPAPNDGTEDQCSQTPSENPSSRGIGASPASTLRDKDTKSSAFGSEAGGRETYIVEHDDLGRPIYKVSPEMWKSQRLLVYRNRTGLKRGSLIQVVFAEPSFDPNTQGKVGMVPTKNGKFVIKTRNMIVLHVYPTHLECIPIYTHGGEGLARKVPDGELDFHFSLQLRNKGFHSHDSPNSEPLWIEWADLSVSRYSYAEPLKVHSVYYLVDIKIIGKLERASLKAIKEWRKVQQKKYDGSDADSDNEEPIHVQVPSFTTLPVTRSPRDIHDVRLDRVGNGPIANGLVINGLVTNGPVTNTLTDNRQTISHRTSRTEDRSMRGSSTVPSKRPRLEGSNRDRAPEQDRYRDRASNRDGRRERDDYGRREDATMRDVSALTRPSTRDRRSSYRRPPPPFFRPRHSDSGY